jgi:hypothetical protein
MIFSTKRSLSYQYPIQPINKIFGEINKTGNHLKFFLWKKAAPSKRMEKSTPTIQNEVLRLNKGIKVM